MKFKYEEPSGADIRALRVRRGETQIDAALNIGYYGSQWSAWERGEAKMPPALWVYYQLGGAREVFRKRGMPDPRLRNFAHELGKVRGQLIKLMDDVPRARERVANIDSALSNIINLMFEEIEDED